MLEKSLANLDRKLDYEINTYTVKLNGVSVKPECFYLEQTFTSEFSKVRKNSEIVFNKKLLTKEEAMQVCPGWNNVVTQLEKHKRDILFTKVYEEELEQHPNK